jgi:hypothetical protein
VAFTHQRPGAAERLKRAQVGFSLTLQPHHGENPNLKPQLARVHVGMVAANIACLFKCADPAQAGRRRNADPLGKFDIGHTPVGLQFRQDLAVDLVKLGARHPAPPKVSRNLSPWRRLRNILSQNPAQEQSCHRPQGV